MARYWSDRHNNPEQVGDVPETVVTMVDRVRWDGKQDKLRFDDTPTLGSANPVTSDGIARELNNVRSQASQNKVELFYIDITNDEQGYTLANCTYVDVQKAYNAGLSLVLRDLDSQATMFLHSVSDSNFNFVTVSMRGVAHITMTMYSISPDDSITTQTYDGPFRRPNPNSFAFTYGTQSVSYDGSAHVSINIPAVPEWAMKDTKPSYTASEVGAEKEGVAYKLMEAHVNDANAHPALSNLSEYVKKDDFANSDNAGVVRVHTSAAQGLFMQGDKTIAIYTARADQIDKRQDMFKPITPSNVDYAVKKALSDCKLTDDYVWTEEEKAKALELLGGVAKYIPTTKNLAYLYGTRTDNNGNVYHEMWEVSPSAKQSTVATRGANGALHVGFPTVDTHATTKKYVDERVGSKDIITTASGSTIAVEDSREEKLKSSKLFGKSMQNQYEGNQLFDISVIKRLSISKITEVTSNSISITMPSGYSGNGYTPLEITLKEICPSLVAGVEYVLNADVSSADMNNFFYLRGATDVSWVFGQSLIMTEALLNSTVAIYGTKTEGVGIISNIMVNKGSVLPWEPYVGGQPSPNPDYPQEIKSLGESGSIGGKVLGKNIWNKEYASDINNWEIIDIEYYPCLSIYVGKGNTVTLKYHQTLASGLGNIYCCVTSEKTWGASTKKWFYHATTTIYQNASVTMTSTDGYIYLWCLKDGIENGDFTKYIGDYLQIELDTEATNYEPYTEQPFTVLTPNGLREGDYVDFGAGKLFQKSIPCKLADLEWLKGNRNYDGDGTIFYVPYVFRNDGVFALCTHFKRYVGAMEWEVLKLGEFKFDHESFVVCTNHSTLDEFMAWLTSEQVEIVCSTGETIETDLTQEEINQFNNLVMNYPNTTIVNDEGAYMEVEYVADTKHYIDNKFKQLETTLSNINANLL